MQLTKEVRAGQDGKGEYKDSAEVIGGKRIGEEREKGDGGQEEQLWTIRRDAPRARLSGRGDRLSSSVLISAFNTLNNRACRAYMLGAVRVVRSRYGDGRSKGTSTDVLLSLELVMKHLWKRNYIRYFLIKDLFSCLNSWSCSPVIDMNLLSKVMWPHFQDAHFCSLFLLHLANWL